MKSKKGQGLPMNTIVIAAIVLIVLVVIIMIFTGSMGSFTGKIGNCAERGCVCRASTQCADETEVLIGKTTDCEKFGLPYCCVK